MRAKAQAPRLAAVPSVVDTLTNPALFAPAFTPAASWSAWHTALKALFALSPTPDDLARYTAHTGRATWPTTLAREAWLVVGRRGGKSRVAALVAIYLAAFRSYTGILAPGERGDRDGHRRRSTPSPRRLPLHPGAARCRPDAGGADPPPHGRGAAPDQQGHPGSAHGQLPQHEGYTVVAAILDEVAFWPTEDSANPDTEIVAALKPAMATVPAPLLLGISSRMRGRARCGSPPRPLRPGRRPRPRLASALGGDEPEPGPRRDRRRLRGRPGQRLGGVRGPLQDRCRVLCLARGDRGVPRPRAPRIAARGRVHLPGLLRSAGGSGSDSFSLAIAHAEPAPDAARRVGRRPGDPPPVQPRVRDRDFAALLRAYRITDVFGDDSLAAGPAKRSQGGVSYRPAGKPKSALYVDALPHLNSHLVELLDHPRLARPAVRVSSAAPVRAGRQRSTMGRRAR